MKVKMFDANEELIEIEEQDAVSVELNDEELAALKKLLPVADKLLALLSTEDSEEEKKPDVEDTDEEEEQVEDSDEENEEKKKFGDSFKSIGAVHQKKESLNDSEILEQGVDNAWSKRYGGK